MKQRYIGRSIIAIAIATLFPFPGHSQTAPASTGGTTSSSTSAGSLPTAGSTPSPGMTTSSTTTTSTATAGSTTANATATLSKGESQYVSRIASRYGNMAGSSSNLESLVHALRTGTPITLAGAAPSTSATSTATPTSPASTTATLNPATVSSGTSVTPATRPMGYGNITRTLELARRQLAASGITNPSPQELQAVLNGGTVKTAQGSTTFQGILKLRAEGMGWGKIAHTIGVHPGMGKGVAPVVAASTGSVGSAASTAVATPQQSGSGLTSASGSSVSQVGGRGVVTAGGAAPVHGGGKTLQNHTGAGVVSANHNATGTGVSNAGGSGRGNGHSGKR